MTIGNAIREPMTVHEIYSNEAERKERVEELLLKVGMLPNTSVGIPTNSPEGSVNVSV